MTKSKAIGDPIPFEPGELVWIKVAGYGPYIVIHQTADRVLAHRPESFNHVSTEKHYYAVTLTRTRPRRWWLLWLA